MAHGFIKDPAAVSDYVFDWSVWLDGTDTISSATVTVPDGLTLDSTIVDSTAVTVWLSGGEAGRNYPVVCQIVTADGRTDERTMQIRVRER